MTLEDLFKGCTKKLKLTRNLTDAGTGRRVPTQEILSIDVRPGWKAGTKITFEGKGDEEPGMPPADLVFVIKEKPHARFQRQGDDLLCTARIPLVTALAGGEISVQHLDGRTVQVPLREVIQPGKEIRVPGEGMPISKNPSSRGALRVKFEVQYPTGLSDQQKAALRQILPAY